MLSVKLVSCCRMPVTALISNGKQSVLKVGNATRLQARVQMYASEARSGIGRDAKRKTIKEQLMSPASGKAISAGEGLVACASVVGLGALCFYGASLSSEKGAMEKSYLWSPVVRERIRDTYMYFGGGLIATAASAVAMSRSPRIMNLVMKKYLISIGATIAALAVGSHIVALSFPYEPGVGPKQAAWLLFWVLHGAAWVILLNGGPLLVRAASYTAGFVGGLSTVAVCAPSEKFLNMGGVLGAGLGVVFVASIGSAFFPPTTALGSGLYSLSFYGCLVLFSLHILYKTQRIIKMAEIHPTSSERRYDPINASLRVLRVTRDY